ncbi:Tyrosine-protein kinase ptk [bacterium HR11]|nr:Tyrosine-protein kinase ptk [bacterium HR11]
MERPVGPSEGEFVELHLRDYWFIVMRHRGVVVAVTLGAVFLTGIWVLVQKPVYRALAVIEVRPERFDIGSPIFQPMMPFTVETFMNTQMNIAQSRAVARMVLSRLDPKRIVSLLQLGRPPKGDTWTEEALIKLLQERVYARSKRQTFLMEIGVEAPSPEASAVLTNAWAESLIEFNRQMEIQMSQTTGEALAEQIQQLQRSIAEKEAQLARLAQTAQVQVLDQQINVAKQRMETINQRILEAQNELVEKLADLRRVQTSAPEALPEIRNNPALQKLQETCAKAEQEYAEKARIFKPDWPGLKQLAIQRDEACSGYRQQARALHQRLIQSAEAEVNAVRDKERRLREEFDSIRAEIDKLNKAAADYQTLKAELENQRRLLDMMTERRQQAQIAGAGNIQMSALMRLIEQAQPPKQHIRPRRLLSLTLALVLGLMGGVGLAFVLHHLDDKIHSHEDIRQVVDYPFLTFIPDMEKEKDTRMVQNAFRFLQGYVWMTQNSGPPVRVLMVTSPQPGEGKTFVAVNLARTLAQAKKRVLLVETDIHVPKFHQIFNVSRRPGLLDLRGQETPPAWDLFPAVNEYLIVIPSGATGHRRGEASPTLEGLDIRRLIQQALETFDYVILDTPPILAVPEALRLVRDVQSIILVVQSGHTTRPALQMAAEQLARIEAPVLGVVLNRVDLTSKYSYYTYYYPYRYYYSYYLRPEESPKK